MNHVVLAMKSELEKSKCAGEPARLIVYSKKPFKLSMQLLKELTNIHIFSRLDIGDPVGLLHTHISDHYCRSSIEFRPYCVKGEKDQLYNAIEFEPHDMNQRLKIIMDRSQ